MVNVSMRTKEQGTFYFEGNQKVRNINVNLDTFAECVVMKLGNKDETLQTKVFLTVEEAEWLRNELDIMIEKANEYIEEAAEIQQKHDEERILKSIE